MAGYSGTALPKKLGIRDNFRVAFSGLPPDVIGELRNALLRCSMVKDGREPLDFVMMFTKEKSDLKREFSRVAKQLAPRGMLWVSWPKKSSGVATDLDENEVRRIGLEAGLVDVKVCAVSEVWSGLKFVIRRQDRKR
jgi:hypothetical protein